MVLEGSTRGEGLHLAIVVARFNERITHALLDGALAALRRAGVAEEHIDVLWVPGAWEIPVAARWLAEGGRVEAVICLGAVIRGGTPHFDFVAGQAMAGAAAVARETGVPVTAGILTTDTTEQAMERSGIKHGNKGAEAAMAAVEMVTLRHRLVGRRAEGS
jgi:6,7-dimethyl-8-ribityllumazine synthase